MYASLGTVAASLLERERRYAEAVELLQLLLGGNACVARRGMWWLRLSINLEHLGQADAALETAEAALADPFVRHGDRLALQRRVLRLGKPPRRWRRPAWAAVATAEPAERRVVGRPLAGSIGSRNRHVRALLWLRHACDLLLRPVVPAAASYCSLLVTRASPLQKVLWLRWRAGQC